MNRKDFIKTTSASAAGFALPIKSFNITEKKDDRFVRVGFIGTGSRGTGHLRGILNRDDIEVPAICDLDAENAAQAQHMVHDARKGQAELYTDGSDAYKKLVERDDLDAVVISTPWEYHVEQSVAAMRAGKYVALEIPAAISIEGCWDIVRTSEETIVTNRTRSIESDNEILGVLSHEYGGAEGVLHIELHDRDIQVETGTITLNL